MSDRSLHASQGTTWQSLNQLAGTATSTGEFPEGHTTGALVDSTVSRRGFMALMSASMALTAAACRRPVQHLVPTAKSLETAIPGLPMDYATVYVQRNVAYGALVKSREGRPIKVKGNDLHPVNRGVSSAEMQASILGLYDPERIRRPRVRRGGGATSYDNAVSQVVAAVRDAQAAGKKAVLVIGEHASPSFSAMLSDISASIPAISTVMMPAISSSNVAMANQAVLGINAELVPDLSKAKAVVCVDADPLGTDPLATYHTSRFAQMRRPSKDASAMSKLVVAEAQYSLTGANADERTRLHPSQIEPFLAVLEQIVAGSAAIGADLAAQASEATRAAAADAARHLTQNAGSAVLMVGRHLSPRAQAMAIAINAAANAYGTVISANHVLPNSGQTDAAVAALEADLNADMVHALIFVDVNPEYSASRSFRAAMVTAPVRVAMNLYEDETAAVCDISIPGSHWLESWGDAEAIDGSLSIRQPLIAPMNEGVASTEDTIMKIARGVNGELFASVETYHDYVKARWSSVGEWNTMLRDGVAASPRAASMPSVNLFAGAALPVASTPAKMVVMTVPSLALYDGRITNNAWLMELPDPVTKITWENVALMSAQTAVSLGIASSLSAADVAAANGRVVSVKTDHGTVDLPAWVQPGMADDVVAVSLGFGRTAGTVSTSMGVNAFSFGTTAVCYNVAEVKAVGTSVHKVACSQDHHTLGDGQSEHDQRPVAKRVTLADVEAGVYPNLKEHFPSAGKDGNYLEPLSITADYEYKGHRWGMVIDMSACTGCSSCVIACQSENNIPTVGKEQVMLGREMHWIRIDRYYTGSMESPDTIVEPMLCQHCENAPCENVCPVAATTHSPEGLNEMTYNRCVGTRYCLNNCPYKVRRFNFLNYHTDYASPMDLVFNPDVTMRMRGVMEKCTFCVQRLHEAKWHARDEGRARIKDGEAITACQEACPAGAIIFGDTNDPESNVSKARYNERGFRVLSELNVRPQVTYLAKVKNTTEKTPDPHAAHAAPAAHGTH